MEGTRKRVLVVDDEAVFRDTLAYNLRREGYEALLAPDGRQALTMIRRDHPDLVILDLMMPGMDGLEVCRALRKDSNIPVLILTAKDEEVDKVVGLEIGADDYITKPYSTRELLARVKAHLRRAERQAAESGGSLVIGASRPIVRGDIEISPAKHEIRLAGVKIPMKPKEYQLLLLLASNPGIVLTREVLLERVWGFEYTGGTTRTVDVHINWLRKKIEEDPANPRYIQTVRGVGYRFAE